MHAIQNINRSAAVTLFSALVGSPGTKGRLN
jgi:hypothetical protein